MIQKNCEYDILLIQGLQSLCKKYFSALSADCHKRIKQKESEISYILQSCESLAKGQSDVMKTCSDEE